MKLVVIFLVFWKVFVFAPLPPGIAINPNTKECGYFSGEDEYGQYYFLPPWEKYYDPTAIKTENGSCKWGTSYEDVEKCCHQLGYTFVSGNIGHERGLMLLTPVSIIILFFKLLPFMVIALVFYFLLKWTKKPPNQSPAP